MCTRHFTLMPFSLPPYAAPFTIAGHITRTSTSLIVRYNLQGPLSAIRLPPPADLPARMNGLWKETCFEFFLALSGSPCYWEFNLSPSGHWNVYHFTDTRQGMREEPAFRSLPPHLKEESHALQLDLECPLEDIIPAGTPLEVAVSTVLDHQGGETTYWALAHTRARPDFHQRSSFLISL